MAKWKYNVRNGKVVYGKDRFRFYILYDLKISKNFVMEICLLRREGEGGNVNRKVFLRNQSLAS